MGKLISLSKKGQVNTLVPAIIAIIIAATFLVLGLVMLQSIRDIDIVTQANTASVANESVTPTDAGTALAANTNYACAATISQVLNDSGGIIEIAPGNYSVSGCILTNLTSEYPSAWNVTYSYTYGDEAYRAGNETVVGLGTVADFWEIIILAVVVSIVIGLLLTVFGGRKQR